MPIDSSTYHIEDANSWEDATAHIALFLLLAQRNRLTSGQVDADELSRDPVGYVSSEWDGALVRAALNTRGRQLAANHYTDFLAEYLSQATAAGFDSRDDALPSGVDVLELADVVDLWFKARLGTGEVDSIERYRHEAPSDASAAAHMAAFLLLAAHNDLLDEAEVDVTALEDDPVRYLLDKCDGGVAPGLLGDAGRRFVSAMYDEYKERYFIALETLGLMSHDDDRFPHDVDISAIVDELGEWFSTNVESESPE